MVPPPIPSAIALDVGTVVTDVRLVLCQVICSIMFKQTNDINRGKSHSLMESEWVVH